MAFPFPLECRLPTGDVLHPVKAFEEPDGDATVYVWSPDTANGAEIVSGAFERIGPREWHVTGLDGVYVLSIGRGCGCGHPMKHWQAQPRPARVFA